MEMTANFWNPGASGGGDLRSTLLARAPQVVTFILALALAAQLAFIVVAMTSRSRQAGAAARRRPRPRAAARHRRPGQRASVRKRRRPGERRCRERAAVEHAAGAGGLLATEDPKNGMAIIGESAQAAKVVAVGQQVPGGAQLHSVYSDRAIIDRGGALESVFLPRRASGAAGAPAAAAHAGGRGRQQRSHGRPHAQAGQRRPGRSSARSCVRSPYSPAAR